MKLDMLTSQVEVIEEITINVDDTHYVLVENPQNFLNGVGTSDASAVLVLAISVSPEFCRNIVFYGAAEHEVEVQPDALKELKAWGNETRTFLKGDLTTQVAPGPYAVLRGSTYQPWRIYYDNSATFMTTLKPWPHALVALDVPQAGINGRVIVPSRCYYKPTHDRPLDGARISVKDNFDLAGQVTTCNNRAWADLYGIQLANAECIQTLINAGAVIVGKVKLQAMILREEPLECVEYTCSFNPRADGYQVPSGSSHGSAAGIASYDWLDFSIGSDTNASGRKPASYNGCYSIRPSTGAISTKGVVGPFPPFDTPVFFGRDLERFPDFIKTWYGNSSMLPKNNKLPIRILYPVDYLPTSSAAQTRLIDEFVKGFESALATKADKINLADMWKKDCPDGKAHDDLVEYLENVAGHPYCRDQYDSTAGFRDDYAAKHGKPPFVHRFQKWQWDFSKDISIEERDEQWRRSELYRHWLLDRVFEAESHEFVSVMVFPIEQGQPSYRDAKIPTFSVISGYNPLSMSPIMKGPELTAPIGTIPYHSTVTDREEGLPVAVSVLGPPGADLILADIVEKGLRGAKIPTKVKTGRSMF